MTTTDKIGCSLHRVADAIESLDEKFGNSDGTALEIKSLEDLLQLGSLGFSTLKAVFENCLGKKLEIKIPGAVGTIINLIINSLSLFTDEKSKTTSVIGDADGAVISD